MKGINKRINNITRQYMYNAKPSTKLIKNMLSINTNKNLILYNKKILNNNDEYIDTYIRLGIKKASKEKKVLYY